MGSRREHDFETWKNWEDCSIILIEKGRSAGGKGSIPPTASKCTAVFPTKQLADLVKGGGGRKL